MSLSIVETSTTQDSQDLRPHIQSREEEALEQLLKDHTKSIAWKSAGPAASDFRSMFSSTIVTIMSVLLTLNHR